MVKRVRLRKKTEPFIVDAGLPALGGLLPASRQVDVGFLSAVNDRGYKVKTYL
jgi:hypothetical protein